MYNTIISLFYLYDCCIFSLKEMTNSFKSTGLISVLSITTPKNQFFKIKGRKPDLKLEVLKPFTELAKQLLTVSSIKTWQKK